MAKGGRCSRCGTTEVCAMQKADVVLSAIRKCGEKGEPLQRVYRQLFNQELYLLAYGKIYRNAGATTPGPDTETVDGMSIARIEKIINLLKSERYEWKPVRRVYIEKRNSTKKRPLGIPGWNDKLVQEVIRLLLEAYYESQFSTRSHGFRPNRGCHTALAEILHKWDGTKWFIEADIKGCFDNIDHTTLLEILAEGIHDNRLLRLIEGALKAGYLVEVESLAERNSARWDSQSHFSQYLLGPVGQVCRKHVVTCIQPRRGTSLEQSVYHPSGANQRQTKEWIQSGRNPAAIQAEEDTPMCRPIRPSIQAPKVHPLCRRLPARFCRTTCRGRGNQGTPPKLPAR